MTDYRTRLTADTSNHDRAIKRSAQQVYNYKRKTDDAKKSIGNITKGIGNFAAALGLAYSGMEIFRMALASSEPLTDKFAANMEVAKSSVTAFINSFMNGSFESCISHLDKIAEAARNAYTALDNLGTDKLWANVGLADIDAQIAQIRAAIAGGDRSEETKKKLESLLQQRTNIVEGLGADTEEAIKTSIIKMLSNFNSDLAELMIDMTDEEYKQIEYTLKRISKSGNPAQAIQRYAETYHRQGGTGKKELNTKSGQWEEVWNNESIKRIYTVISNLGNVSEKELAPILTLLQEQQQRKQQNAQITAKATKMGNGLNGSTDKGPKYAQGSIEEIEMQINELKKRITTETLQGNEVAVIKQQIEVLTLKKETIENLSAPMQHLEDAIEDMPTLDATIIDGEGIKNELQTIIDNIEDVGLTIEDLEKLSGIGDSIGYIGDMFHSVADIAGEEGGKIFSALGESVSAVGAAIAKISSLMLAEGAASVMDLPFPANMAALASVVATVMTVISSIQSIGTQHFAEGGIVQGKTTIGDHIPAMLNAGEMVLNKREQMRLFHILNAPTINTTNTGGGNVTFTIHGSDLYGTLNNYEKIKGRAR